MNNPFSAIPEEYTLKKEQEMQKKAVKRMSAQQRQINKVHLQCMVFHLDIAQYFAIL